jgi:hypothetical protein
MRRLFITGLAFMTCAFASGCDTVGKINAFPEIENRAELLEEAEPGAAIVVVNHDMDWVDGADGRDNVPSSRWFNLDLEDDDWTRFIQTDTSDRSFSAHMVEPGLYQLFWSTKGGMHFFFGRNDPIQIAFKANPGEVVYVGTIHYYMGHRTFRIKIDDHSEEARRYLATNFPGLEGEMKTRLARYVRMENAQHPPSQADFDAAINASNAANWYQNYILNN